jgi:hypothetical protein
MNQAVIRKTEFKSKPVQAEDDANREFQLYCEALQSYPDATSRRPSLSFAEYFRDLQELKAENT